MKFIFLISILFLNNLFANDIDFIHSQALKSEYSKKENKEEIIGGSIAFAVGNIGFFTTESTPLRLSYSLIQSVGIINISDGIYNYYSTSKDKYYYALLKKYPSNSDKEKILKYFSRNIISINAKNDKAIRMARFYRSSLLATQYVINTLDQKTSADLKNIYYFLAGINIVTATYSYFNKSEYEKYYDQKKTNVSFTPAIINNGGGFVISQNF